MPSTVPVVVPPSASLSGTVVGRDTSWTWGQLTDQFLEGYSRTRPATFRAYRTDLEDWAAWCALVNVDPMRASRQYVQAYVKAMSDRGLARSTIARRLSALSRCYKLAVDDGQLVRSPTTGVDRPRSPSTRRRPAWTGTKPRRCATPPWPAVRVTMRS